MVSSPNLTGQDTWDISAGNGTLWPVTTKLSELVQYKILLSLWNLAIWIYYDCFASGSLSSTRHCLQVSAFMDLVGLVKLCQIAKCCPVIIRCVSVLRLDHVHQNVIPCKYLWCIAMKMNFSKKEGEDKTWPFNTMTAQVDGQMKDFQQIINYEIFGSHYIPPSGWCWNVIAYFLFAQ